MFFYKDPPSAQIYTLSLHDALPIYSVAGNVVTLVVEGSSYPNWIGGDQKRTITSFTREQMIWTNSVGSSGGLVELVARDRKSTRLNSSHRCISYAVFCLKKKNNSNG